MAASKNATIDHDEIRRWVEERGGRPATVKSTGGPGGPGLLRIDYPGYSGEGALVEISWDDFFQKFEEEELAFIHQDETAGGEVSRFSKLVRRDTVDLAPSEPSASSEGKEPAGKGKKAA